MKKQIFYLFIYLLNSISLFSQNQINGYDYVVTLKNDANFGQIDFFKKEADPCATNNEKSLYGFNSTILNPNPRLYLNFKVQVTDCAGKIYEQTISTQLSSLQEGFNDNIYSWNLLGTLTTPPYSIKISNSKDQTYPILVGQLKPADPDSLSIITQNIVFGKKVELKIIGGDDLSKSQTSNWSWRIGSPNGQEYKTQSKSFSFIAESNTTVYLTAISKGPNNTIVSSKTITKNIIVDTKSYAPSIINATHTLICSTSTDGTTLSINDGILGKKASWVWYKNGCGDQGSELIESGKEQIKIIPNATTNYFVRAESSDNTVASTNCISITINVVEPPIKPIIIINDKTSSSIQICEDQTVDLKLNGQTALNNDNSHWEWYSKNAKENGLNAVSNETKLNLTSNAISVTAKNNGFYYAVSSGGVCDNVTSESAYILVKKKTSSNVYIKNVNIGSSRKHLLEANQKDLGEGSKYFWYTGQNSNENAIANLQPYGEGNVIKINAKNGENRYVYISGKGECDIPQIPNGHTTIMKYNKNIKSQFVINFGTTNSEDPKLATSFFTIGQTGTGKSGYYFKYVTTNPGPFTTNNLVVDKTTKLISNYPTDGTYYKYISDAKTYNSKSYIIGGILTDKKQSLSLYYGLGYGEVETIWGFNKFNMVSNKFMNIGYAKNQEKSFSGFATEVGLMLRIWYFNVNGGIGAIFGSSPKDSNSQTASTSSSSSSTQTFVNGHFGIGFSILSRK
jgi:hypothetical protein